MLTTGSKYFFGFAAFALVAAFVYGGATANHELDMATLMGVLTLGYKGSVGDHVGYSILITLAGSSALLGCVVVAFRDADAEAGAQLLQLDTVPESRAVAGTSPWPIIGAFGVGSAIVGMVVGSPLVILGAAMVGVSAFEWAIRSWSERATGDPAVNRTIRDRVMQPIEIPLLAVVGIAVFVLAVSRILLALPKLGGYFVFGGVPTLILLLGWFITTRPRMNRNVLTGILLLGGVAVLVAGVVSASVGPRDIEPHHEEHSDEEGAPAPAAPGDPVVIGAES